MTAQDPDYHLRDLHTAIASGDHPSWTVKVQVMPFEDAADYRFNPFDLTKVWPHADYPRDHDRQVHAEPEPGRTTSPRSSRPPSSPPTSCPASAPSPDKMLQGRLFSYPDTHRYRIGTNYLQLPVNRPQGRPSTATTRTAPCATSNPGDPVYAPNTAGGPVADPSLYEGENYQVSGEIVRSAYTLHRRGRRLRPAPRPVGERPVRNRPRPPGEQHRRPRLRAGGHGRDEEARRRILAQRPQGPRPGRRPGPGRHHRIVTPVRTARISPGCGPYGCPHAHERGLTRHWVSPRPERTAVQRSKSPSFTPAMNAAHPEPPKIRTGPVLSLLSLTAMRRSGRHATSTQFPLAALRRLFRHTTPNRSILDTTHPFSHERT